MSATLPPSSVGWRTTRLLDVTRHHSGNGKLIKGKLNDTPADGLFPAFSASGQDVWRDAFEHEGDAIIVSAVGARCGKCFLASGKWSAVANTHVVWPNPEHIERKFLWYRVNDERFWERSGSAQPFVVVRKTFERDFLLPPLPEQRRIVAEIEKQFTRLEAGVAALRRVQANLKRYRAAVLKSACEGRLVPTEAELCKVAAASRRSPAGKQSRDGSATFESGEALLARILTERRQNWQGRGQYKEPVAADATKLTQLPAGWTWATVEPMLSEPLCNGISIKGSDSPPGIRTLRLSAMSELGFDYSDTRYLPLRESDVDDLWIKPGDFFVSRGNGSLRLVGRGTLAQAAPQPTIFPDTMIRLRLAKTIRNTRWLPAIWSSYFIRSQIERKVKTTAGIYKIAQPQVEQIVIPLPPLAEQTRIVAEVERRLSVVEELEAVVSANLQAPASERRTGRSMGSGGASADAQAGRESRPFFPSPA